MIASVCAALFAWAKYQTTINGTATGETAKWSFKVSDGDTSTQSIDFPMTRTDSNTSVAEGKIAPGTYGKLEIEIDATGTETALTYIIEGKTDNLPTNLKFYSDEGRTLDLAIENNSFSKGGYMKLNEVGKKTEIIYWEWPFETGISASVIDKNDEIDMQDSAKTMSMSMSVTGKQLNGNPILADIVQVGDYVNYNASSNGEKTFLNTDCPSGVTINTSISTDEAFNSEAKAQWRVLSVNRNTGSIELVSVDPTKKTIKLSGGEGFANSKEILDNIGAIYGQGQGAIKGRALSIEDINKYSRYTPSGRYGNTTTFTNGNFYKEIKNGNVIEYENSLTDASTEANGIEMTETFFAYDAKNYITNSIVYNMLLKKGTDVNSNKSALWLNSRMFIYDEAGAGFGMRILSSGKVNFYSIYFSDGKTNAPGFAMCPVVTLESNIKTTGQDSNGVWQLNIN